MRCDNKNFRANNFEILSKIYPLLDQRPPDQARFGQNFMHSNHSHVFQNDNIFSIQSIHKDQ